MPLPPIPKSRHSTSDRLVGMGEAEMWFDDDRTAIHSTRVVGCAKVRQRRSAGMCLEQVSGSVASQLRLCRLWLILVA